MNLGDLQQAFGRSIAGETGVELLQLICEDGLEAAAQLGIYRNNVVSRLSATLRAAFPVVCSLVGTRFFDYVLDGFICEHLPQQACLSEYGGEFPSFLQHLPPGETLPYLADVASLEWQIHRAQRAPAESPIPITRLNELAVDPAVLRFRFTTESAFFFTSPYPIDAIWRAHQPQEAFGTLKLEDQGVNLQVSGGHGLRIVDLPRSTWEFRAHLAEGGLLGSALSIATGTSADFDIVTALVSLFAEGLIVEIYK